MQISLRTNSDSVRKNGTETVLAHRPPLTTMQGICTMADRHLPSIEEVRQLLRYEPDTGKLFWKETGQEAFRAKSGNGYRRAHINGKRIYAHRLIWAIVHGFWPEDFIDHIDGDGYNNKLTNLRAVSRSGNARKQSINVKNTSGAMGVYWRKDTQKWSAEICINHKKKRLGAFADKELAIAARREAEREHGFHPNHGRVK